MEDKIKNKTNKIENENKTEARVVVVTGSARGIGLAILKNEARLGRKVVVSDLDAAACDQAAEAIRQETGAEVLSVVCDVTSKVQLTNLVQTTIETFGRIDVWVNNAGVKRDGLLLRMTEADWDEVFAVNVKAAFAATQLVARPMMKNRYGRIINIGSISGHYGNAGQINYSASKAALHTITKSAARELAGRNITVNCLVAGFIDNDFAADVPVEIKESLKSGILLKSGDPEQEVAKAVSFLASDDAGYITGALLRVDGGMAVGF